MQLLVDFESPVAPARVSLRHSSRSLLFATVAHNDVISSSARRQPYISRLPGGRVAPPQAADAARQLQVLHHNGHPLGVQRRALRVSHQSHQVRLRRLLRPLRPAAHASAAWVRMFVGRLVADGRGRACRASIALAVNRTAIGLSPRGWGRREGPLHRAWAGPALVSRGVAAVRVPARCAAHAGGSSAMGSCRLLPRA